MFPFFRKNPDTAILDRIDALGKDIAARLDAMGETTAGYAPALERMATSRDIRRMGSALQMILERQDGQAATLAGLAARQPDLKALLSFAEAWELGRRSGAPRSANELALDARFDAMLAAFGLECFGMAGDAFDPSRHEACDTTCDANLPDGRIASVVAPGFTLNGRVVRQAVVVVNRLPG